MEPSQSSKSTGAQMLEIGKQCSHEYCLLVDFLPIKCQHCQKLFCGDHFKVEAHHCQHYDESKYDRVAPNCPMCNVPVAFKPGQDPNVRMEEHFEKECVATGKAPSRSTPTCARGNCRKVLYTPIKCDKCRKDFCATHRFPKDHNCSAPPVVAKVSSTPSRLGSSHPLAARFSSTSSKNTNTTSATATKATTSTTDSTRSIPNISSKLFDKTDRRARAERKSKVKAMRERMKKGLLSDREKAMLAEEERELEKERKGECTMM